MPAAAVDAPSASAAAAPPRPRRALALSCSRPAARRAPADRIYVGGLRDGAGQHQTARPPPTRPPTQTPPAQARPLSPANPCTPRSPRRRAPTPHSLPALWGSPTPPPTRSCRAPADTDERTVRRWFEAYGPVTSVKVRGRRAGGRAGASGGRAPAGGTAPRAGGRGRGPGARPGPPRSACARVRGCCRPGAQLAVPPARPSLPQLIYDKESGRSKGFGFVSFEAERDARDAMNDANGRELDGRVDRLLGAPPPPLPSGRACAGPAAACSRARPAAWPACADARPPLAPALRSATIRVNYAHGPGPHSGHFGGRGRGRCAGLGVLGLPPRHRCLPARADHLNPQGTQA